MVVPGVPVGRPRVRDSGEVVTKFEPMVFPVVLKAEGMSYVVYAVTGATGTRTVVVRGFYPMSTTLEVTDGAIKEGPVVYEWKAVLETPVGDPETVTVKGSVVEGPVLGEVPARGTAGT